MGVGGGWVGIGPNRDTRPVLSQCFQFRLWIHLSTSSLRDYGYEEASRAPDLISSRGQGNLLSFFKELQNGVCQ